MEESWGIKMYRTTLSDEYRSSRGEAAEEQAVLAHEQFVATWRDRLSGYFPARSLPAYRTVVPRAPSRPARSDFPLDRELVLRVRAAASVSDSSAAEWFLTALLALLFRHTEEERLLVAWYEDHENDAPAVLPLGVLTRPDLPFLSLLDDVRAARRFGRKLGAASRALLASLFPDAHDASDGCPIAVGFHVGASVAPASEVSGELVLCVCENGEGLQPQFIYNEVRYHVDFIAVLAQHWVNLLQCVVADPSTPLDDLELASPQERVRVREWSLGPSEPEPPEPYLLPFQQQVERASDKAAVVDQDRSLSFGEVDIRANQFAHCLGDMGVGPEVAVAICMPRSAEMVVCAMAVLKAGGALFFLDPTTPRERVNELLDLVSPAVLITREALGERLANVSCPVVCIEELAHQCAARPVGPPDVSVSRDQTVVLVATSGSTGRPRIVQLPAHYLRLPPMLSANDRFLLKSDSGTTFSAAEVFRALFAGGTLFVAPPGIEYDPSRLAAFIGEHGISCLLITPTQLSALLELDDLTTCQPLRLVECIGEPLPVETLRRFFEKLDARLEFGYGCTEAPGATARVCSPSDDDPALMDVGRPAALMQVFVLDARQRVCPVGVAGEVYLGGELAEGYWNDPDATRERFIPHLFDPSPGVRLFRSGDRARWLPGGRLEVLGRRDGMVKIRGYRVELGEIEARLAAHPAVARCAALLREDRPGTSQLVAYWLPRDGCALTPAALHRHLANSLPAYMVPSAFVRLESLPLTSNGKLDRNRLPAPDTARPEGGTEYTPADTATERVLARIWAEVLGIDRVGVHDDFFELGGDSILAAQMFSRIEEALGRKLPFSALFQGRTVRRLSTVLQGLSTSGSGIELLAIQPRGSRPPLFFLPDLGGDVLYIRSIVRHLHLDQPIFGLDSRHGHELHRSSLSLEQIASRFVDALGKHLPQAPYGLAGHSFGGMLAFEVARQLVAAGHRVPFLAVIDTGPGWTRHLPAAGVAPLAMAFLANLPAWIADDLMCTHPSKLIGRALRRARSLTARLRRLSRSHAAPTRPAADALVDLKRMPQNVRDRIESNAKAFLDYVPEPYAGRVTVIRARCAPLLQPRPADLGWGRWAGGGVKIHTVPGNHMSILDEPRARLLATILQAAFDRSHT
jgi:aspartate racemase